MLFVTLVPWDRNGSQVCLLFTLMVSSNYCDVQNTQLHAQLSARHPGSTRRGPTALPVWNMQPSWEGNGLMNNQRIRQTDLWRPGESKGCPVDIQRGGT